MIPIRSPEEIERIAEAGRVVAGVLDALLDACRPGVTALGLDALARRLIADAGGVALFPGFSQRNAPPYPAAICACVNDQVTHAVPTDRPLEPGDLVTLDTGVSVAGWCADASRVLVVGADRPTSPDDARAETTAARLAAAARAATDAAIAAMRPGTRWSDAADACRAVAEAAGFRVAPIYAGHGIGRDLHEVPRLPFYPGPRDDFILRPGMVVTVEPILLERDVPMTVGPDAWTVTAADGVLACQVEETVAVTREGARVLTAS
ncbi:MAG: type I methionyl aminopeptidase [Phycisphaerales bacterium]|nr:type I methionyl aminopeptidase [Phycisphaerales bacterium]